MSAHKSQKTIRPPETGCNNSNVRPRGRKCGGLLVPETAFSGNGETLVVLSVGCVNCGERIFRGHQRRTPDSLERNAHKLAGRPGHMIDGRRSHNQGGSK